MGREAAGTQPVCRINYCREASFCDVPEHFLAIVFLACSPLPRKRSQKRSCKGILEALWRGRCPSLPPQAPDLPDTSWMASHCVHMGRGSMFFFSLPPFLQTNGSGAAALPACFATFLAQDPSGGRGQPGRGSGNSPGPNPGPSTTCGAAGSTGTFPGEEMRDGILEQHRGCWWH